MSATSRPKAVSYIIRSGGREYAVDFLLARDVVRIYATDWPEDFDEFALGNAHACALNAQSALLAWLNAISIEES